MRKYLLILVLFLFVPITVNAESKYLYDVLKNAAETTSLAKEYTGEHRDSFTKEPTKKIYHWYTRNLTDDVTSILNKNNVIFGNFCWQMFRTTDTGGVKIIYNGIPNEGKCNNTGTDTTIGSSKYNSNSEIAKVGYMYNTSYPSNNKELFSTEKIGESGTLSTSWWYSSSINYNSLYSLSDPFKVDSTDDYSNLVNHYTFSSGNELSTSESVKYIYAVVDDKYYYFNIQSGNGISYYNNSYTYGNDYTENNDGTYTINNPTTINANEYYANYSNINNKYICKNANNNTCEDLWYVIATTNTTIKYYKTTDSIKFANNFIYDNGEYTLNNDSVNIWNYPNDLNNIASHHYTCFDKEGKCTSLSYVYRYNNNKFYYLNVNDGKSITDILNEMLYNDDVNTYNSAIKTKVDTWYQNNLIDYTTYLEDTIFCADRRLKRYSGFEPDSGPIISDPSFIKTEYCSNEVDKFSVNNPKAKLTYPVGLLTYNELYHINSYKLAGKNHWLMSPVVVNDMIGTVGLVYGNGLFNTSTAPANSYNVRPVVSLKPKTRYLSGTGSTDDPFIVDYNQYYEIDVEINNETEDLNIEIDDLTSVSEGEEVNFKVTPIKGFKVNNIRIVDENNNEIDYTTTDNKNYTFTMPATDVTIIPSYERVKNSVNVEDNKNTKEFVIEVNDAQAVVYEDTVRFRVEPEEGYEVEDIDITDEEQNKISYKKTNNQNEYEFTMPDSNVLIKPKYRLIPKENNSSNILNPDTKRQILLVLISIIVLVLITYKYKKKRLT